MSTRFMTSFSLIRPGAHRVMPWKNGGGSTAEIAIRPAGASVGAGFDWRLSIATVASDGPFSAFPQHDRVIMLLAGNGMVLGFEDGRREILDRAFRPLRFSGSEAATCRLIDGACEDLNLMVARDRSALDAAAVGAAAWPAGAPLHTTRILFLLRGEAEAVGTGSRALKLRARDTLLVAPGDAAPEIRAAGNALAFSAIIRPRAGPDPFR